MHFRKESTDSELLNKKSKNKIVKSTNFNPCKTQYKFCVFNIQNTNSNPKENVRSKNEVPINVLVKTFKTFQLENILKLQRNIQQTSLLTCYLKRYSFVRYHFM